MVNLTGVSSSTYNATDGDDSDHPDYERRGVILQGMNQLPTGDVGHIRPLGIERGSGPKKNDDVKKMDAEATSLWGALADCRFNRSKPIKSLNCSSAHS